MAQQEDEYQKRLREYLQMMGVDPQAIGLVNDLTLRDIQDPMEVAKAVGGEPGFYQGNKLGAYIYPPGPIQQSHPFMAALAGMEAKRRNEAERARVAAVGRRIGGGQAAPSAGGPGPSVPPPWMAGLPMEISTGPREPASLNSDAQAYMDMIRQMGG